MVVEAENLLGNRFQWIRLRALTEGDVGIANVYAPNSPMECYYLWATMVHKLYQNCKWILNGDWNMVENKKDKSNSCGRLISQVEWLAWEQLKTHLNVQNGFDSKGWL